MFNNKDHGLASNGLSPHSGTGMCFSLICKIKKVVGKQHLNPSIYQPTTSQCRLWGTDTKDIRIVNTQTYTEQKYVFFKTSLTILFSFNVWEGQLGYIFLKSSGAERGAVDYCY